MNRADLLRRLRRAQSLAQRGATEGERAAAALAVDRLTRRIDALPPGEDDEAEPKPRRGFDGLPWAADGAAAPDRAAVLARLQAWVKGAVPAEELRWWAAWVVDKCVLPELPPDDPESGAAEIVLHLASRHRPALRREDWPPMRALLTAPAEEMRAAWRAWLEHLAGRSRVGRRG
ncbi:hypothetical protein L6R49_07975 [Myxococcota bacterium]|nr:hypothetical protein [Myxococcota bacterium]